MTQTRRIILNILATYGQSLLSFACVLFIGRWLLEALDTSRYGVFCVVGEILGLVGTDSSILSSARRLTPYGIQGVFYRKEMTAAFAAKEKWGDGIIKGIGRRVRDILA